MGVPARSSPGRFSHLALKPFLPGPSLVGLTRFWRSSHRRESGIGERGIRSQKHRSITGIMVDSISPLTVAATTGYLRMSQASHLPMFWHTNCSILCCSYSLLTMRSNIFREGCHRPQTSKQPARTDPPNPHRNTHPDSPASHRGQL